MNRHHLKKIGLIASVLGFLVSTGPLVGAETASYMERYYQEASTLAKTGSHSEALNKLNAIERSEGSSARLYKMKAHVYFAMKDYHKSLEYCDKRLAIEPEAANAHFDRAVVLYHLTRYKDASKAIKKARQINPADEDTLTVLMMINSKFKR